MYCTVQTRPVSSQSVHRRIFPGVYFYTQSLQGPHKRRPMASRREQVSASFFISWTQCRLTECFPWAAEGPNPPKETLTFKKEFFWQTTSGSLPAGLKAPCSDFLCCRPTCKLDGIAFCRAQWYSYNTDGRWVRTARPIAVQRGSPKDKTALAKLSQNCMSFWYKQKGLYLVIKLQICMFDERWLCYCLSLHNATVPVDLVPVLTIATKTVFVSENLTLSVVVDNSRNPVIDNSIRVNLTDDQGNSRRVDASRIVVMSNTDGTNTVYTVVIQNVTFGDSGRYVVIMRRQGVSALLQTELMQSPLLRKLRNHLFSVSYMAVIRTNTLVLRKLHGGYQDQHIGSP